MRTNEQQVRHIHNIGHYRRMIQSRLRALSIMSRKRATMQPTVWAERMDLIQRQLYNAITSEIWCEMHPAGGGNS